jgi:hypothetical protein
MRSRKKWGIGNNNRIRKLEETKGEEENKEGGNRYNLTKEQIKDINNNIKKYYY